MTVHRTQSTKKAKNLAEFKKLHNRLVMKYLAKDIHKKNQVMMKSESTSAAERAKVLAQAKASAEARATAEAKALATTESPQQGYAAAGMGHNNNQSGINIKRSQKRMYDPISILAKVEGENHTAESRGEHGVFSLVSTFISNIVGEKKELLKTHKFRKTDRAKVENTKRS